MICYLNLRANMGEKKYLRKDNKPIKLGRNHVTELLKQSTEEKVVVEDFLFFLV